MEVAASVVVTNENLLSEASNSANTATIAQNTSSDSPSTVTSNPLSPEDLTSDTNSLGTEPNSTEQQETDKRTMSEDVGDKVAFMDPLCGDFSPDEDKNL